MNLIAAMLEVNHDDLTLLAVIVVLGIIWLGLHALLGDRVCWGCGGSGVGPDGQMACPRCSGKGKA